MTRLRFEKKLVTIFGVCLILVGILCNQWLLSALFSDDGFITPSNRILIWLFEIGMLVIGVSLIWFSRTKAKIDYRSLALLGISLAICLVVSELGSHIALRYLIEQTHNYDIPEESRQLRIFTNESDPWGVKRNFKQKFVRKEFETIVKTNNIGIREERDYHGEKIDIAFVGDSFTFGYGVNHGERYSDLLRTYWPEKNILSLSYLNGFTTPHYYLLLKRNPQLIPEILIMGLFPYNDLTTDIEGIDFVLNDDGELGSTRTAVHANDKGMLVDVGYSKNVIIEFLSNTSIGRLLLVGKGLMDGSYQKNKSDKVEPFYLGKLSQTNLVGLEYVQRLKHYLENQNCRLIVFLIPKSWLVGQLLMKESSNQRKELF